jgi:uncharacterized membrane protein
VAFPHHGNSKFNFMSVTFVSFSLTLQHTSTRPASSRAVLVQLTPLLGAIVGMIVTLILVAVCLIIFVKFKKVKFYYYTNSHTFYGDRTIILMAMYACVCLSFFYRKRSTLNMMQRPTNQKRVAQYR